MRKTRIGLFATAAVLTLLSDKSFAQVITGSGFKKADVNITELAKYYKEHPIQQVKKLPFEEDEEEDKKPFHSAPDPALVHTIHKKTGTAMGPSYGTPMLPVSPAPIDTFLSTTSPGFAIPPDTHGAVDSQYCVTAINTNIHIQTRVGGEVLNIGLDGFWASVLPSGTGAFDPRVHYDPYYKRWILVTDAVANSTMTNSTLLIGVSVTNDPTGAWHLYSIAIDPTGASWLDFPNVGYNNKWIMITGNMFPNVTGGAHGAVVYLFDYVSLMAGTFVTPTKISHSSSFAICPATTYDFTEPNLFALETWNSGMGQLNLWKISGPVSSPTMTSIGFPATTQHWHGNGGGGGADFAPQAGTTHKIDAGDDRITSVTYRNHRLWCSHTVFLPSTGTATRCSVMWWQIDTLAVPVQNGLINDAVTPSFFDYSSIAVNANDDALIGFGYLSGSIHPSAAYALHMHTDPADSTRPVHVFRHGQGAYYETFGGGKNRYGDYSGTCIDPRNDTDFWTIQESTTTASTVNWDTWWANIQLCAKPHEPAMDSVGPTVCAGGTIFYSINPIPGATSYQWLVGGTGWTGSSATTSITVTAGTGIGTIVVLAYNACGEGESHTFTVTPIPVLTVPPTINVLVPACTGTATATYTTSMPGAASYLWQALGTGWSGTSTSITLNATVGTGTGYIICTAVNQCGNSPTDTLVVVPGSPVATFSTATYNTLINVNDVITFTGTAPTGSVYAWSFGGGTATPGTGPGPQTVFWTTAGTKTVTLFINNSGCTSSFSDTVHVRDVTGFQLVNNPNLTFNIAPNPNDGSFNIVFNKQVNKPIFVQLADMQGRIVYSNDFSNANDSKLSIVTDNLAAGTYVATIRIDGDVATEKITINR